MIVPRSGNATVVTPILAGPWWSTGRSLHTGWGGSLMSLLGSCGPQILVMENLLRLPQVVGSFKVDHQVLEKRNRYLYFKVHLHYWQTTFSGLETKYHKSSQNKSIAMNKPYYSNIQLEVGLTNEH